MSESLARPYGVSRPISIEALRDPRYKRGKRRSTLVAPVILSLFLSLSYADLVRLLDEKSSPSERRVLREIIV